MSDCYVCLMFPTPKTTQPLLRASTAPIYTKAQSNNRYTTAFSLPSILEPVGIYKEHMGLTGEHNP